jgi:[ribosomal protein S18]-alanine N-acetyltransferase
VNAEIGDVAIAELTQQEADEIAGWRYDPPYDFYDWSADVDDLDELLDAAKRGDRYFSARDGTGALVGFFVLGCEEGIAGIGIGLRPDLTGRGLGLSFLENGLAFAKKRYAPDRFRLNVAEFNRRAIKVYERAGFTRTRSFVHETNGGVFSFVEMERAA